MRLVVMDLLELVQGIRTAIRQRLVREVGEHEVDPGDLKRTDKAFRCVNIL